MSRIIKFRAFDKVSKSMSKPFSLFGEFTLIGAVFAWLDHVRKVEDGTCGLLQLNDIEVVQFTGLHDVNGVEIYEGDIVSVPGTGNAEIKICQCYGVVYKADNGYGIYELPYIDCAAEGDYPTVLGNIYEHPHLLDGSK